MYESQQELDKTRRGGEKTKWPMGYWLMDTVWSNEETQKNIPRIQARLKVKIGVIDRYMDDIWMIYGWYMDDIWMIYGWYRDIWGLYWNTLSLLVLGESSGSHQLPFDDLSHLISNFKIFKHQVTAILAFQACTCFSIQTGFDGFFETSTAQTPHLLEAVNLRLLFHQGDICHLSDQKHSRRNKWTFIDILLTL